MPQGDSASPDDPDWVDQILSRAMEQAESTDPAPVTRDSPPIDPDAPGASAWSTEGHDAMREAPEEGPASQERLPQDATSQDLPAQGAASSEQAPDAEAPFADSQNPPTQRPQDAASDNELPRVREYRDQPAAGDEQTDWEDFDPAAAVARPAGSADPDARLDPGQLLLDEEETDGGASLRGILEWGAVILGALTVALLIKTFLMQAYFIPSDSMVPTLKDGDRILVNKVSYNLHDVNRGDLVVFHRPPTQPTGEDDLIKRVIGLGGETIRIENNEIFINNRRLDEQRYLPEDTRTETRFLNTDNCSDKGTNFCVIKEGHVFVMGDNRLHSQDSRFFGPIDEDLIVGRAFLRVWPPGDIGAL